MIDRPHDARVRTAAFEWLAGQVASHGDVLPWSVLNAGFPVDGERVRLIGPQGIFKPRTLAVPLTITTAPKGPYDDSFGPDGLLRYRYRGTDATHADNAGLRTAMRERLPLIYFHGIAKGKYLATWPVFIVQDDPRQLTFAVAVDDARHVGLGSDALAPAWHDDREDVRREYVTAAVRRRLHQRTFRERVLEAYHRQCAFCRLRHEELLDAAHIIPDAEPDGEPVVSNGLALCKLHHVAFDRYFVGVRPDHVIQVRPDILREGDGPTLRFAIQALHGERIKLPRRPEHRPDEPHLTTRYERFLQSAG